MMATRDASPDNSQPSTPPIQPQKIRKQLRDFKETPKYKARMSLFHKAADSPEARARNNNFKKLLQEGIEEETEEERLIRESRWADEDADDDSDSLGDFSEEDEETFYNGDRNLDDIRMVRRLCHSGGARTYKIYSEREDSEKGAFKGPPAGPFPSPCLAWPKEAGCGSKPCSCPGDTKIRERRPDAGEAVIKSGPRAYLPVTRCTYSSFDGFACQTTPCCCLGDMQMFRDQRWVRLKGVQLLSPATLSWWRKGLPPNASVEDIKELMFPVKRDESCLAEDGAADADKVEPPHTVPAGSNHAVIEDAPVTEVAGQREKQAPTGSYSRQSLAERIAICEGKPDDQLLGKYMSMPLFSGPGKAVRNSEPQHSLGSGSFGTGKAALGAADKTVPGTESETPAESSEEAAHEAVPEAETETQVEDSEETGGRPNVADADVMLENPTRNSGGARDQSNVVITHVGPELQIQSSDGAGGKSRIVMTHVGGWSSKIIFERKAKTDSDRASLEEEEEDESEAAGDEVATRPTADAVSACERIRHELRTQEDADCLPLITELVDAAGGPIDPDKDPFSLSSMPTSVS